MFTWLGLGQCIPDLASVYLVSETAGVVFLQNHHRHWLLKTAMGWNFPSFLHLPPSPPFLLSSLLSPSLPCRLSSLPGAHPLNPARWSAPWTLACGGDRSHEVRYVHDAEPTVSKHSKLYYCSCGQFLLTADNIEFVTRVLVIILNTDEALLHQTERVGWLIDWLCGLSSSLMVCTSNSV